ncbi:MAG TPA: c-type cytochrome domain-containing protein [Acidobacteriaceae bacterium]
MRCWIGSLLIALGPGSALVAQKAESNGSAFFDSRVQTILCNHCILCHNDRLKNGNVSFEHRESLLHGGSRGPTVVPFKPDRSVLIHAVRRDGKVSVMMPPGPPLSGKDVATLTEWIKRGAPWGSGNVVCEELNFSVGPDRKQEPKGPNP